MEANKLIPIARLVHRIKGRVRIRIGGIKQDKAAFFNTLESRLKKQFNSIAIQVNPITGSVVLKGDNLDMKRLEQFAKDMELFQFHTKESHTEDIHKSGLLVGHMKKTVQILNTGIKNLTMNRVDMASLVFVILIYHAVREIVRGNLAAPSWFTAFWFASTLYYREH